MVVKPRQHAVWGYFARARIPLVVAAMVYALTGCTIEHLHLHYHAADGHVAMEVPPNGGGPVRSFSGPPPALATQPAMPEPEVILEVP